MIERKANRIAFFIVGVFTAEVNFKLTNGDLQYRKKSIPLIDGTGTSPILKITVNLHLCKR
jgi:hypothetical protein